VPQFFDGSNLQNDIPLSKITPGTTATGAEIVLVTQSGLTRTLTVNQVTAAASGSAAAAQATANTALANAATAQTTANTAVTNAATAQTTANTALTTANAAVPSASLAATSGPGLIGWIRAGASAVATTVLNLLGWQEISAFEFMTVAQIADYQSGAMTLDLATPLQAWLNACAASASSGGKLVGRLPPGGGRVGTTLTATGAVVIRGHGTNSSLRGWGVPALQIAGDHVMFEDFALFAYSNVGVADPRTQSGIVTTGTNGSNNNYARIKRVYFQGWNRCIDFSYMSGSVVDDVTTVNANVGIRYFGQCVNNAVSNSRLVVNSGTTSIQTTKDTSIQGEGLLVTNCLLASGTSYFTSDGWLLAGFYNCTCDLASGNGFDVLGVSALTIDCPWVYAAQKCVNLQALGSPTNVDAVIKIGLAQTTGSAQACIVIGANNNGGCIVGGTYVLTNAAGSVPIVLASNNWVLGSVIVRNATTNSDVQVNGSNIRISQEAYLPNGIQTVVSQIRVVTSAATTALPFPTSAKLEVIQITGNTGCTSMTDPAAWPGKTVELLFTGTPTWTKGGNLHLNSNITATVGTTLTVVSDGTNWYEIGRSIN
jgi:hypothetical protein